MDEQFEISRDLYAFINELFPHLSEDKVVFVGKIVAVAFVLGIIVVAVVHVLAYCYKKKRLKQYIENLPVQKDIDEADISDSKKEELKKTVSSCVHYGYKIDYYTDRKFNSRMVSSLVYEICRQLEFPLMNRIIYALSSMVYDIGFLDVPEEFFRAEVLSKEEKIIIRKHVLCADSYFTFVPGEFQCSFMESALYHHENLDGTGYPEGLVADEIPQIAKILRVAESYVSMTSRRSYHRILSAKKAIEQLEKQPNVYDSEIVGVLKKVVTSPVK